MNASQSTLGGPVVAEREISTFAVTAESVRRIVSDANQHATSVDEISEYSLKLHDHAHSLTVEMYKYNPQGFVDLLTTLRHAFVNLRRRCSDFQRNADVVVVPSWIADGEAEIVDLLLEIVNLEAGQREAVTELLQRTVKGLQKLKVLPEDGSSSEE